ncbi:hypothetical protein M758_4G002700 [Ceratodon purpureus]|nr:hypothetical protein M758_4G002700 [Ceratodon purpureus]
MQVSVIRLHACMHAYKMCEDMGTIYAWEMGHGWRYMLQDMHQQSAPAPAPSLKTACSSPSPSPSLSLIYFIAVWTIKWISLGCSCSCPSCSWAGCSGGALMDAELDGSEGNRRAMIS